MRSCRSPGTSCNMRLKSPPIRRSGMWLRWAASTKKLESGWHTAGDSIPRRRSRRAERCGTSSAETSENLRGDEPPQGAGPLRWEHLEVDPADCPFLELDRRARSDQARGQFTEVRFVTDECDP